MKGDSVNLRHVGYPNLGSRKAYYSLMDSAFDRNWLTNDGPLVREFEEMAANFLRVPEAVAVCNATIGLQIALRACDCYDGKVIMPAWTVPATACAVAWMGLEPVFVDVGEDHLIDPEWVRDAMDEDVVAVIGVHLWGKRCDIPALDEASLGVPLIFDAAHALSFAWGGYGDAEVFSLHATKMVNSFEGGIVTANRSTTERIRALRCFGYAGEEAPSYVGMNAKMSESHAAMGIVNLERYEEIRLANAKAWDRYKEIFGARLLDPNPNCQYVVIEVDNRDRLMERLRERGILARRYGWPGLHRTRPFFTGQRLPVTEWLAERTLVLPTGLQMTDEDFDVIANDAA